MTTWRGEDYRSGRNISRRDYHEDANYPGGNVPVSEEGAESQEHGGSGTGQAGGYVGWTARMESQGTQPTGERDGDHSEGCKRCGSLIPTITRGYECDCEGYEDLISSGTRLPPKVLGEMEKLAGKIVRDPCLEATGEMRQRQAEG